MGELSHAGSVAALSADFGDLPSTGDSDSAALLTWHSTAPDHSLQTNRQSDSVDLSVPHQLL